MNLKFQITNSLASIQFMRKEKANSLSRALMNEFHDIVLKAKDNQEIRCLTISGEGEKVFSAGADLEERKGMSFEEVLQFLDQFRETLKLLEDFPVPTVAILNGSAFGGGLEIALACDIRLMKESALIGLTETKLGIIPGAGGTQRLSRLVGPSRAKDLIFRAAKIKSSQAKEYGIVTHVFGEEGFSGQVDAYLGEILSSAPIALRLAKRAIKEGLELSLEEGLDKERSFYLQTLNTKDRLEALQAFQEKRPPVFRGE